MAAAGRAVSDGAAPMRIPFQHVPDRRIEDDAGFTETSELDACAPGMLLYKQAEDRFKVLAEKTHRERRQSTPPQGPVVGSEATIHRGGIAASAHLF